MKWAEWEQRFGLHRADGTSTVFKLRTKARNRREAERKLWNTMAERWCTRSGDWFSPLYPAEEVSA